MSAKFSKSLFFLPCLIGAYSKEILYLFKQQFLIKPVNGDKYLKKKVFLLKVSHILLNYHTAKLNLFVVLKHFCGNSYKFFFFRHKSDYRRKEH